MLIIRCCPAGVFPQKLPAINPPQEVLVSVAGGYTGYIGYVTNLFASLNLHAASQVSHAGICLGLFVVMQ